MLMLRRSNVRARAFTGSRPSISAIDLSRASAPTISNDAASMSVRDLTPMPSAISGHRPGSMPSIPSMMDSRGSTPMPSMGAPATPPPTAQAGSNSRISNAGIAATGQFTYRNHFGLTNYPFSDIRLPTSFWDAGPYAWVLRTLTSQLSAGQRPAMLVGDPGSGRTFVCEMIRNKFPRIHTFTIEPQLLFGTRLLVSLCRQLGAPSVSADAGQRFLIEAFLTQALSRAVPDAMAVIVVDGVDPADRDLVLELEDILRHAPARLSMLLIGTSDLPSALAANGAPYGLYSGAQPLLLPGMSQQEMVDYIDFRMRSVGGASRGIELDIATQQLLHARSGGSPKLINVYCHNALTVAALRQERGIDLRSLRIGMKSKSYLTPEAATALLAG
jgi:type II secretory pathway predicted ATPase ExeA